MSTKRNPQTNKRGAAAPLPSPGPPSPLGGRRLNRACTHALRRRARPAIWRYAVLPRLHDRCRRAVAPLEVKAVRATPARSHAAPRTYRYCHESVTSLPRLRTVTCGGWSHAHAPTCFSVFQENPPNKNTIPWPGGRPPRQTSPPGGPVVGGGGRPDYRRLDETKLDHLL